MLRKIKKMIVLLIACRIFIPASIFADAVGEFSQIEGTVRHKRNVWTFIAAVKAPIELKDAVVTDGSSKTAILFSDESTVLLEPNSTLFIEEYVFDGTSRKSTLKLTSGTMTADVKKFIGGKNAFRVQTPTALVEVRGTRFTAANELINNTLTTTVTCHDGLLSINYLNSAGAIVSTPVTTIFAGKTAIVTSSGITVSGGATTAVAAAAASEAGTTAATAAVSGLSVGTITAGVAAAAAVAGVVAISGGEDSATTTGHQSATVHH